MKKKVDPEKAGTKVVNFFLTKIVALYFFVENLLRHNGARVFIKMFMVNS